MHWKPAYAIQSRVETSILCNLYTDISCSTAEWVVPYCLYNTLKNLTLDFHEAQNEVLYLFTV
jgi:hypothetical protein